MSKIQATKALTTGKGSPFENALAKGYQFVKTRHCGLELAGELVTNGDLETAAEKLGVTPEILRTRLADDAHRHQETQQRLRTAAELFDSIRAGLPGVYRAKTLDVLVKQLGRDRETVRPSDIPLFGTPKEKYCRLVDSILEVCHGLHISITSNHHGSFFMTRLDEVDRLRRGQLEQVFQSFIDEVGILDLEGSRLLAMFLVQIRY